MNEPPGARARVAITGLTVAEYFRDQEGSALYIGISSDNLFNLTNVVFFNAACYRNSCINSISKRGYFQFVNSGFVIRAFQERDRRPDVKANTSPVPHKGLHQ